MNLKLHLLNHDVMRKIVSLIGPRGSHLLHITHRNFRKVTTYDYSLLTTYDALQENSYQYLQMVQEIKEIKLDIEKYFTNIIHTNNYEIISSIIDKSKLRHVYLIRASVDKIVTHCSPEIVFYLLSSNLNRREKEIIFVNNKLNIINFYSEKGIDLFASIEKEWFETINITDLEFLKYIFSKNYPLHIHYLKDAIIENNFPVVKWLVENMNQSVVDKYLKSLKITDSIYNNIYSYALENDALNILRQEDIEPNNDQSTSYIIHNASKNIFNNITKDIKLLDMGQYYKILYYIIIYENDKIYENIGDKSSLETYKIISKLKDPDCIYDFEYIKITSNSSLFIKKYKEKIIKLDDVFELLMTFDDWYIEFSYIIYFHKHKIIKISKYERKSILFVRLSLDDIIYVCRSGDQELISNALSYNIINLEHIVEYCTVPIALKYIHSFSTTITSFEKISEIILRRGNLQLIKYYVNNYELYENSLFYAYSNCPFAAKILLRSEYYENINLSKILYDKDSDSELINEYVTFILSLNPYVNCYALDKILYLDNILLYEYYSRFYSSNKSHVNYLIKFNAINIMKAIIEKSEKYS